MTKEQVLINHIQEYLDSGMWQYEACYLNKDDLKVIIKALDQEPCEDCISREQMMNLLDEVGGDFDKPREAVVPLDYVADMVADLPSVRPKEKVGHWQKISADKYSEHAAYYFRCSECGKDIIGEHNYCPNCGCRMKGSE